MDIVEFKTVIWEQMRDITIQMSVLFRPYFESFGLTVGQTRILFCLSAQTQLEKDHTKTVAKTKTISSLSQKLGMAPGNLSAICKSLENRGMLTRRRDKEDERVVQVFLTEQGEKTLAQIKQQLENRCGNVLHQASQEDLYQILDGIRLLQRLLEKMQNTQDSKIEPLKDVFMNSKDPVSNAYQTLPFLNPNTSEKKEGND